MFLVSDRVKFLNIMTGHMIKSKKLRTDFHFIYLDLVKVRHNSVNVLCVSIWSEMRDWSLESREFYETTYINLKIKAKKEERGK